MTLVRPFRALRYDPERIDLARVIVPPYDVIAPDDRAAFYERDPHNAIRLELTKDVEQEATTDYAQIRDTLDAWRRAGVLTQDPQPALSALRQCFQPPVGTPTVRRLADLIARAASQGGQEEGTLPHGGAEGRVRLMTIHGAKGLEAPVVLLVDADRPTGKESPRVRTDAGANDTPLLFKVNRNYRKGFTLPDEVSWPLDALQTASGIALARDRTEEANLLYVAMTRARDRLYVLGGDKRHRDDHDSPLRRIQQSAVGYLSAVFVGQVSPADRLYVWLGEAYSVDCLQPFRLESLRPWHVPLPAVFDRSLTLPEVVWVVGGVGRNLAGRHAKPSARA